MNDSEISDIRKITEFKGMTFSKYKKSLVKKELLKCLDNDKVEQACYWSAELICAGLYADIWDVILTYISKNIHLGNPKLPIYINMRFQNFKEIVNNGYVDNELSMRNNSKIRILFGEIICVICLSNKKHKLEKITVQSEEFDMTQLTLKLKAPSILYIQPIFKKDDPKELFIAANEFAYQISKDSLQSVNACYWVEWIIEFESICKKKKQACFCERRSFIPVPEKFQMDVIWIVWDIILYEAKKKKQGIQFKILEALLELFCLKYSVGIKKKRRFILYQAILLLTERVNYNVNIISDQKIIEGVTSKIDVIYKQIKKNEIAPQTDYLFNNIGKSNLEKTIEKIDKMNSMNVIVPRNK